MKDTFRVQKNPSLDAVVHGMRQFAWLGAANPQAVAIVNKRLTQKHLGSMQNQSWLGTSDPKHGAIEIRSLVEQICSGLQAGDYAGEILACYYWMHQNIRYMRDPYEIELVKEPIVTMRTKSADCDDISVLLASMLMASGNECQFILASFAPNKVPSHVFTAVKLPGGAFLPLDPVANRVTKGMFDRATRLIAIPCGPG